MKKVFSIFFSCASFIAFGQAGKGISKGLQVNVVTTTSQNLDMGMQMTSTSTTSNKVNVLSADDKVYTLSNTLTHFLFKGNIMGKDTNFDSDKTEDRNSEEGKQFAAALDKTDTVLVDVKTGTALNDKEKSGDITESDNPMSGLMSGMAAGSSGSSVAPSIIFKIPVAITKGSSWTDSSTIDNMKSIMVYSIENISNGIATISTKGSVNGTSAMELQGNSFDMTMDTKVDGDILVDIKTNLVKKRTNSADIKGNIQMMGQEMPFTSKTSTESVYQ